LNYKKNNLLIFVKETQFSGSVKVAALIGNSLSKNFSQVKYFPCFNNSHDLASNTKNIENIEIKHFKNGWITYFFYCFLYLLKNREIRYNTIVHTHSTIVGFLIRPIAKIFGFRTIHTIHGISFHNENNLIFRLFTKYIELIWAKLFTDELVSVNQYYKKYFKDAKVIYNSADVYDLLEIDSYKNKRNNIIFVGRLSKQKNPLLAIDVIFSIADVLRKNNWKFKIYGDGPLRSKIENLILKYGIGDIVVLYGWVSNNKSLIYKGKLLLVTSDWEALPLNILEAGKFGIPAISRPIEGLPETIIDGVTGHLVNDKSEFKSILTKLIKNYSNLERLSNSTLNFHKNNFLPEDQILEYFKVYANLLSKNKDF
jgi:glycosyltransferase involved in cell wall biosynthesis